MLKLDTAGAAYATDPEPGFDGMAPDARTQLIVNLAGSGSDDIIERSLVHFAADAEFVLA